MRTHSLSWCRCWARRGLPWSPRRAVRSLLRIQAPDELVVFPSDYCTLELAKGDVQQRSTWVAVRRTEMALLERVVWTEG